MKFKFFSLTNVALEDCKKVYSFCLNISDSFRIGNVNNYSSFEQSNPAFFREATKNIIYNGNYRLIENNDLKRKSWETLFSLALEKADVFYLKVPLIEPLFYLIDIIKKFNTITIEHINLKNNEKYIKIYGSLSRETREFILNLKVFDFIQLYAHYKCELRLIENRLQRILFISHKEFFGTCLCKDELDSLEKKHIFLDDTIEKKFYRVLDGELTEELKNTIKNNSLFHNINQPRNGSSPLITNCTLFKNDREIFFYDGFYNRGVCFTDTELQHLTKDYNVNISDWLLVEEKDSYIIPNDYIYLKELC
jgi:hypothetical protein